jgi:hypothetical protein
LLKKNFNITLNDSLYEKLKDPINEALNTQAKNAKKSMYEAMPKEIQKVIPYASFDILVTNAINTILQIAFKQGGNK